MNQFDPAIFASVDAWIALVTLSAMEIVLGIDNIVFITIITDRLAPERRPKARALGLSLALVSRLGLLFAMSWVMSLTVPLFELFGHSFSGRDLILGSGGLFLIAKSTHEIFGRLELGEEQPAARDAQSLPLILVQIMVLDIIFSLDSVVTAVGMAKELLVMMIAMVLAVLVMLSFAGAISDFISRHPSMKILALSFLLMIGVMLCAESFGQHINKGYIYFAMGFSLLVELINIRVNRKAIAR